MNRVYNTFKNLVLHFKKMNAETFTKRKNLLEEFYKERMKFNISKIEVHQVGPDINIYENMSNIFFKHILLLLKTGF